MAKDEQGFEAIADVKEIGVFPDGIKHMGPFTINGAFDIDPRYQVVRDLFTPPNRTMTVVFARRFLWWDVTDKRLKLTVTHGDSSFTEQPDGLTLVSVSMNQTEPADTIISPWYERLAYYVAWLWSWRRKATS